MKVHNIFSLIFVMVLLSCSSSTQQSNETAVADETPAYKTDITGKLPLATRFYKLEENILGELMMSGEIFDIRKESDGSYKFNWDLNYPDLIDHIVSIKELEPGKVHEISTTGEDGEFMYRVSFDSESSLWVIVNTTTDRELGKFCDVDATHLYDPSNFKPLDYINKIGNAWTSVTDQDGEWVVFEECLYGAGGLAFDEEGNWVELSGGGDAYTSDIDKMEMEGEEILIFKAGQEGAPTRVSFTKEGEITLLKYGEEWFVREEDADQLPIVEEEC